jgi:NAD(P)-dependent dehydrogenase (short-subunit alcohol dehydrogenase family)
MTPFDNSLDGRVALVSGASSGIGRGCAVELARAGATVLCVSRSASRLEELVAELVAEGGRAEAFPADLGDDAQAEAAVARAAALGDLRVAVNAAGMVAVGPAHTYPLESWDALFAINVRSTFLVSRTVANVMLDRDTEGSIVNFSSILGTVAVAGTPAYVASKHAVEGLTKALAVEWGPVGIRVNAVAPGSVETPMVADYLADPGYRAEVTARMPISRLIEVEEVARAVAYLASDASTGITGHILRADGGWTAC